MVVVARQAKIAAKLMQAALQPPLPLIFFHTRSYAGVLIVKVVIVTVTVTVVLVPQGARGDMAIKVEKYLEPCAWSAV